MGGVAGRELDVMTTVRPKKRQPKTIVLTSHPGGHGPKPIPIVRISSRAWIGARDGRATGGGEAEGDGEKPLGVFGSEVGGTGLCGLAF